MSADCLFVLRNVTDVDQLKLAISSKSMHYGYGTWFSPVDTLLLFHQIVLAESDYCLAPTDAPDTVNVDLLISHENHYVNGKRAELPLKNRTLVIQELARECLRFSDSVEIYISEDNPYLPEYNNYIIECGMVADTLYKEYKRCELPCHVIPSVALFISKNNE